MFTALPFVNRTTAGQFVDANVDTPRSVQVLSSLVATETAAAAATGRLLGGGSDAPAAPTAAQSATAGVVDAGHRKFKVAYVFPWGTTTPSSATSTVTLDGTHKATVTFAAAPAGATGTNIYANSAGLDEVQRITLSAGNAPVNELQRLTLTAGAAADTFKLTFGGTESSVTVTLPGGGFAAVPLADIQACLAGIPALVGNVTVTGAAGGPFDITFNGSLAGTNVGDVTMTSKTGAADGNIATITTGSTDSFKITFSAVESSIVNIPSGGFAQVTLTQIQTALTSIAALVDNYTATGSTGGPFTVTFNGSLTDTNVGAMTITSKVGAADGSVATITGGVAQGGTFRKAETGTTPSAGPADTTYAYNTTDAALAGFTAAPTTNTSGAVIVPISLAAGQTLAVSFANPVAALRLRLEIDTGAMNVAVHGQ